MTDDGRKDILDGKTLEETCRLGGMGTLRLPTEYAVGQLTVPTCLSAAATYLMQSGKLLIVPSARLLLKMPQVSMPPAFFGFLVRQVPSMLYMSTTRISFIKLAVLPRYRRP